MEEALRVNLYRTPVPDSVGFVPDNAGLMPETRLTDQQRRINEAVLKRGQITSAEAAELLKVGERRSREILKKMVDNGILKKEGSARTTIYVRSERVYS